jgi:hypothetical protein
MTLMLRDCFLDAYYVTKFWKWYSKLGININSRKNKIFVATLSKVSGKYAKRSRDRLIFFLR